MKKLMEWFRGLFGRQASADGWVSDIGHYEGAAQSRLLQDWVLGYLASANQEIRYSLSELRARS